MARNGNEDWAGLPGGGVIRDDISSARPLDANVTGTTGNDTLVGTSGSDVIDGGPGADRMTGYLGDDTYYVDNAHDVVVEADGEGTDLVYSSVSFNLAGQFVENLTLTGSADLTAAGNGFANHLTGNSGANRLNGGAGADVMSGGAGNDVYIVDDAGDVVTELAGQGSDRVESGVSYTLGANVENLYLTGSALTGTGNALANLVKGNSQNNILDGGAGADDMRGGKGEDVYFVDNAGDKVVELDGEGNDTVDSSVTFSLANQYIEVLNLTGSAAINGTGNGLNNRIVGNGAANTLIGGDGNDRLDGGAGADTLKGGLGNDTYVVENAGDKITENNGDGTDTVEAWISYSLVGQYIETLKLMGSDNLGATGNGQVNALYGNAGNNLLNGMAGADTMAGGAGDDTYVVDDAGDKVIENANEGTDLVQSSVTFSLANQYIEALTLTGSAAANGTGNNQANTLTGNTAANTLNGSGGDDQLHGGLGSDTLTGGAGLDTFWFETALGATNVDTITDFKAADDTINLLGGLGGIFTLNTGALAPGAFQTGTSASSTSVRILYDSGTGKLYYDADGSGAGAKVQFASVTPGTALSAGDFTVTGTANHAPVITSGAGATVAENSAAATIVYQIAASDSDGQPLHYALSGADAALLTVDSSGAVRLINPADYETKSSYSFSVVASDPFDSAAVKAVTLTVTDVADGPGSTPQLNETSAANDSTAQAQVVSRASLAPSVNANLPDDSLPSVVIHGNVATSSDADFYAITLAAGEQLILDVDNSGGNLDTVVHIYDAGGTELGSNDDAGAPDPGSDPHPVYGHNTDSTLRYRAPTSGTYYFSINSYPDPDNPTSGTYDLNVSVGPVATPEQIMQEDVQALLSGYSQHSLALTYSFPTSASQYDPDTEEAATLAAFNPVQQAATARVLQMYASISPLTFTPNTAAPADADLRYAMSDTPDTAYAYYPTGSGADGQAWFNKTDYNAPEIGNYGWTTILHETGHLMGLKHGHEAPAVSAGHDTLEYTVMTYRSYEGASPTDGYTDEEFGFPQTLMMLDIAAIQAMYGANFGTNSGNSVYAWSPTTGTLTVNGTVAGTPGANRVFMTVWDGGGVDTYDLSAYTSGVSIDLRPGEWTKTSQTQTAYLGDGHYAVGNIANALLYQGQLNSLIENAIGGSGADGFTANQVANSFTGNGGADTFYWKAASDGGTGTLADTITDFNVSQGDRISFADIDLNPGQAGHESFAFIGTTAFHHVAGEIRYDVTSGNAHVMIDTDGNGVADMEIVLNGISTVSGSMFAL